MNAIISTRKLRKSFDGRIVLSDIDLDIPEGALYSVVGQSGTGKSVLFKTLIGMIKPDSGQVWYRDTELTALDRANLIETRHRFGYAFQNAALFDSMTVGENIAFPLREVLGIRNKAEIRARVTRMLDWIELPGIEKMRPNELSGGMRKRVGVARALVMQPDVVFFDEPTTETINALVVRVNRELRITCIFITHDIPAAFRISSRIAFLHQGSIVAEGEPADVARSEHALVREFIRLSFSELNL